MSLFRYFQPLTAQFKRLCAAAGLALFSMAGNAAVLNGSTVDYHFDDSLLNSLFGSVSISGDVLSFSPVGFEALANLVNNPPIITTTDTTPLISVTAKSGYVLNGLSLAEQGNYYRIESAPASSFVGVSGEFVVNGAATQFSANQPLTNAFGFAELANGVPFITSAWNVDVALALNALESATVKVQNILVAGVAGLGNSAFIAKNLLSIGAFTTQLSGPPAAVPVPGAVWLFGTALLGWIGVTRRKTMA
ncbi:PEP-CTERM sorting domain-containing protein [Methylomonas sp. SURF-2]|uniref:PEP-CTERM sorting domain-containing protein n=1 Tax=Methylomonas subterranea TaxID=2952225 RepID=A0ABT1TLY0_9GAMM|nr:PEP-CTERM sorting domain-containing protein [Methylomonas sp. SURF-2]MCQ8105769.1 PEP-CTERM sorting domain-containing protein [Methylomonas sp. SURF-2]